MEAIECSNFTFYNNFDSANLARVVNVDPNESIFTLLSCAGGKSAALPEIPDAEFNIWTKPDCGGTEFENGNRTWFYFGVRAREPLQLVRLNIVDLNRQSKMFSQGMAPVFRTVPGKAQWERVRDKPLHNTEDDIFTLSFKYRTPENTNCVTYFAFTYPFSYVDLQKMLSTIDLKFADSKMYTNTPDDIYYRRELLCKSLGGREVTLLTITSHHGITCEQETRLENLFPDTTKPRPFKFSDKKVIFLSARVHPGETPSSFVFNGFLNLLLTREDPIAIALRKLYVFKMIPFLNPDGVALGHYRTDTRGVNLNRVYLNPLMSLHPTIYAARALLRYHHYGEERPDLPDGCDSASTINDKVSHMTLEENRSLQSTQSGDEVFHWCVKCKSILVRRTGVSIVPNGPPGANSDETSFCAGGLCDECKTSKTALQQDDKAVAVVTSATDNPPPSDGGCSGSANGNESGIFLYLDMHGHASKKGIFMYGNHFEDAAMNVECMLLPKLMSVNNHHFHFTSCNFTERNMYLRDKRDGMSREGSGRVAVLKVTGLIRSYTLECNYNTGRIVNVLPPTVREHNMHAKLPSVSVPPKYTPHVFEEVGKSLGASILDLTGDNPVSRIPYSEFHTLAGIREFLLVNCATADGMFSIPSRFRHRNSAPGNLQAQGKCGVKSRQSMAKSTAKTKSAACKTKATQMVVPVEKSSKENNLERAALTSNSLTSQPCCSGGSSSSSSSGGSASDHLKAGVRLNKNLGMKSKSKKDFGRKLKTVVSGDKQKSRIKLLKNVVQKPLKKNASAIIKNAMGDKTADERVKFCFPVKECGGGSSGTVAAAKPEDLPWKTSSSSSDLFAKSTAAADLAPGASKSGCAFGKSSAFVGKPHKYKKHTLRRLANAAEGVEKVKKRKKLKSK